MLFLGQLPLCFGVWVKGGTIRKGTETNLQEEEREYSVWKKKKEEGRFLASGIVARTWVRVYVGRLV